MLNQTHIRHSNKQEQRNIVTKFGPAHTPLQCFASTTQRPAILITLYDANDLRCPALSKNSGLSIQTASWFTKVLTYQTQSTCTIDLKLVVFYTLSEIIANHWSVKPI